MRIKQIICGYFCCSLSLLCSGQINNIIFLGGSGNGSTSVCYALNSNNTVFGGGNGSGVVGVCFSAKSNNLIFAGRDADGSSSTCFTLVFNNTIFAGGDADGNTALCFLEMPNNMIFAGAEGDGSGSLCFTSISGNQIFAGGFGDGLVSTCFIDISNNQIFAGGAGDGINLGKFLVQPATIVWHGRISSNWHNPDNWDQNRVPTIDDVVIIRTEVYNPFIVAGWLGVGDQSSNIREFAQHLHILDGSGLTLDPWSRANIQQDLYVYGSFSSLNSTYSPVLHLFNGGSLTITSEGLVHLMTQ